MNIELQKKHAAEAAIEYIKSEMVVGVGTGSTANYFIDALVSLKGKIEGAIASSKATAERLKALHIPVIELNHTGRVDIYVDGADEINDYFQCIKGGGGALTGEKIVASVAKTFICIADSSKKVSLLGTFPIAIEVIPMARSAVARQIVKLGGSPVYREGFVSDYGNVILDVYNFDMRDPAQLETTLNNIPGVVCNGIFAMRPADILLLGSDTSVVVLNRA